MARLRANGVRSLAVPFIPILVLAVSGVAACAAAPGGTPPGPGGTAGPGASTSGAGIEAATGILNAAKLADRESLDALEGIRFTPAGTAAAAAVLGAGPTGDALWAATYVYASSPGDSAPLLTVAASSTASASVRVMAAAGLTAAGKLEGLDALVGLLGAAGAMDGAEPPDSVWAVAADVLERYTHAGVGPPGAGDEAARTASAAAWSAWLAAKRDHLRFDAPNALWVAA